MLALVWLIFDAVHYYLFLFLIKNLQIYTFWYFFVIFIIQWKIAAYMLVTTTIVATVWTFLTFRNSIFALFSQNAFKMNEDYIKENIKS
jgi:hypothetical protein